MLKPLSRHSCLGSTDDSLAMRRLALMQIFSCLTATLKQLNQAEKTRGNEIIVAHNARFPCLQKCQPDFFGGWKCIKSHRRREKPRDNEKLSLNVVIHSIAPLDFENKQRRTQITGSFAKALRLDDQSL